MVKTLLIAASLSVDVGSPKQSSVIEGDQKSSSLKKQVSYSVLIWLVVN